MGNGESVNNCVPRARSSQAEATLDAAGIRRPHSGGPVMSSTRPTSAILALFLGVAALSLNGCTTIGDEKVELEPIAEAPPPMDVVLVSDLLRFFLDGEMEFDRGITDCYDGLCVQTDGERILFSRPEMFVFAGHHDEVFSAHEDTIEDRNGIMIGDVSLGEKELPDILGVAVDRTITGYGGWGEYVGFDSLYYDYVRNDRPQRMVLASLGGWASEGNPPIPPDETWTWTGGAMGVDYSDLAEDRVLVGNSALTVSLLKDWGEYTVHVAITDLVDVAAGTTYDDMIWRYIPLRDGGFETFEIRGRFFGPSHEEVGGVFERDQITGAFGATREE